LETAQVEVFLRAGQGIRSSCHKLFLSDGAMTQRVQNVIQGRHVEGRAGQQTRRQIVQIHHQKIGMIARGNPRIASKPRVKE
jgi:hypothetical protein